MSFGSTGINELSTVMVKMMDFHGLTPLLDVREFTAFLTASQQGNLGAAVIHV